MHGLPSIHADAGPCPRTQPWRHRHLNAETKRSDRNSYRVLHRHRKPFGPTGGMSHWAYAIRARRDHLVGITEPCTIRWTAEFVVNSMLPLSRAKSSITIVDRPRWCLVGVVLHKDAREWPAALDEAGRCLAPMLARHSDAGGSRE